LIEVLDALSSPALARYWLMAAWHCSAVSAAAGDATAKAPSRAEVATTTRTSWRRVIAPGPMPSLAVSAGTVDRARGGVKETGEPVDPPPMSGIDLTDDAGPSEAPQASGAAPRRWPRLPRPTGIRNGGLLLVLVALAAVIALVDQPPETGGGRRLPSIFQSLTPPTGITALPPVVAQPPPATRAAEGELPASADRAHPRRVHPLPARSGTGSAGDVEARPVGDPGGSGSGGSGSGLGGTTPPVDVTPPASVRVPPASVRVTSPTLLGRDLPGVRVATPEVAVETPAGLTALR
jgi:hypothetical protein